MFTRISEGPVNSSISKCDNSFDQPVSSSSLSLSLSCFSVSSLLYPSLPLSSLSIRPRSRSCSFPSLFSSYSSSVGGKIPKYTSGVTSRGSWWETSCHDGRPRTCDDAIFLTFHGFPWRPFLCAVPALWLVNSSRTKEQLLLNVLNISWVVWNGYFWPVLASLGKMRLFYIGRLWPVQEWKAYTCLVIGPVFPTCSSS